MKILEADYSLMKKAIDDFIEKAGIETVLTHRAQKLGKDIEKRFRWDLLHASCFDVTPLYRYMNDEHIDSALKHYVKNNEFLK